MFRQVVRGVHTGRRGSVPVVCVLLLASFAFVSAPPDTARPESPEPHSPPLSQSLAERLEREVTETAAFRHLRAFQRTADRHGGNRGPGTPGYSASADYVRDRLSEAGYHVRFQEFTFPDFVQTRETAVSSAPDRRRELHPYMARFSPSTPAGGLRAELTVVPGQGCAPEEYEAAGARGRIALVRGEECSLTDKQRAAAQAGVRLLLMNIGAPGSGMNLRHRMKPPEAGVIPSASLSRGESEQLAADAAGGRTVTLRVVLRGKHVRTRSFNVLADTPTGRADRTVVLGAHLDSVPEGPGIDDNASSAAMVLETALRLAPHAGQVRNRVRFAWWGAEERGMVGSQHYVDQLSAEERDAIALNLNFETIGAPNYARMVYDGDDSDGTGAGPGPPGSAAIEEEFTRYFARRGLPTVGLDFDGRSDFGPFIEAGIPAGGGSGGYNHVKTPEWQRLFGGRAGQYLDPCYHQTCDTTGNIDRTLFGQFGDAMAYVTGRFARDLSGVGRW
ncbi:M20/M25/M40 family metallo-hydrolase [Streptomyces daliensis]|uniref:M20/M25/M40 family metallo-hydrolase n=1 Tax=Streptomyces daliensis TaxID=299421 RepID=A0A8T4IS93_9ACTN|nr:M20/M25/M40 family metallo-hydrolase [Streptomyces daliensis]